MGDKQRKCRDCKWFDWSQKHSVGYVCVNPNITHAGMGHLHQPSNKACKRGFESNKEFIDFLKELEGLKG